MRALVALLLALLPAAAQARTVDAVWTAAAERAYVNRQAKGFAGDDDAKG